MYLSIQEQPLLVKAFIMPNVIQSPLHVLIHLILSTNLGSLIPVLERKLRHREMKLHKVTKVVRRKAEI